MGVRSSVFGSKQEKACFRKLKESWGDGYNLYHNLPFLSVFTGRDEILDGWDIVRPSDAEFEQLKKLSIDFTVCDKHDAPLVCIEFDGLQNGFNVGSAYHHGNGTPGRADRRALLELKLRVAHGSGFPYFVLGSEQFRGLSDRIRLTIADALIGEVMSNRACHDRIAKGFNPEDYGLAAEEFEAMPTPQQNEIIQDWVIGIEVESDYSHNPIFKKVAELSRELGSTSYCTAFMNDEALDRDVWVWVECTVTSHYGSATSKVYVPNFKTPHCYFTVHIAQEIGRLMALEQLRKQQTSERIRAQVDEIART